MKHWCSRYVAPWAGADGGEPAQLHSSRGLAPLGGWRPLNTRGATQHCPLVLGGVRGRLMLCCPVLDQGSMGLPSGLGLDETFSEWLVCCLAIVQRGPERRVQRMGGLLFTGTACPLCQCAAIV